MSEEMHPDVEAALGGTRGAAIGLHQLFQELIDAGFSRKEALAIVIQQLAIAGDQDMLGDL